MFELDIVALYELAAPKTYTPINRFPAVIQDLCLKVPTDLLYGEVDSFVWEQLDKISKKAAYSYILETIDIFQKSNDKKYKHITWRITIEHQQRTLRAEEVNKVLDKIAAEAKRKFNAERI